MQKDKKHTLLQLFQGLNVDNIQIVELGRMPKNKLQEIRNEFATEKMRLDKFFSLFLEEHNLDMEDNDSNNWLIYRKKLKEYSSITQKIKWSDYYLGR